MYLLFGLEGCSDSREGFKTLSGSKKTTINNNNVDGKRIAIEKYRTPNITIKILSNHRPIKNDICPI